MQIFIPLLRSSVIVIMIGRFFYKHDAPDGAREQPKITVSEYYYSVKNHDNVYDNVLTP